MSQPDRKTSAQDPASSLAADASKAQNDRPDTDDVQADNAQADQRGDTAHDASATPVRAQAAAAGGLKSRNITTAADRLADAEVDVEAVDQSGFSQAGSRTH